jgi:hypothetical protein
MKADGVLRVKVIGGIGKQVKLQANQLGIKPGGQCPPSPFKVIRKEVILPLELADSSIIRRVCSRPQANSAIVQRLCLGRNAPSASRDKPNTVSGALRPKARVCEALRQFMSRECTLHWLLNRQNVWSFQDFVLPFGRLGHCC